MAMCVVVVVVVLGVVMMMVMVVVKLNSMLWMDWMEFHLRWTPPVVPILSVDGLQSEGFALSDRRGAATFATRRRWHGRRFHGGFARWRLHAGWRRGTAHIASERWTMRGRIR